MTSNGKNGSDTAIAANTKRASNNKGSEKHEPKSDIPHNPKLDNALTVLLLFVCVYLTRALIEEKHVVHFCFHAVAIVIGRRVCYSVFHQIGLKIGTKQNLSKPRNLRKFCEQSWSFVTHLAFTIVELMVLKDETWWSEPATSYFGKSEPRPAGLVRTLYLFQMATYAHAAFAHRFFEARHKDYFVMYTHHIVTLALLAGSHHLNAERFGLIVLTVHDLTDVPADLTKMANYMGLDASSGLFLTEACFAGTLISWAYVRLYIFPFRMIKSTFFEAGPACEGPGKTAFDDPMAECWILRVFMIMLAGMHYFWYYLFLRILYRLIKGADAHSAGRDDYEGDSDTESEGDKKKQKKN